MDSSFQSFNSSDRKMKNKSDLDLGFIFVFMAYNFIKVFPKRQAGIWQIPGASQPMPLRNYIWRPTFEVFPSYSQWSWCLKKILLASELDKLAP